MTGRSTSAAANAGDWLEGIAPLGEVIPDTYGLLEGPRFDGGRWLFSDVTLGGVWALPGAGAPPVPLVPRRRGIGGVALHEDGVVIGGRNLLHVGADGAETVLLDDPEATGVNDLHVLPDGSVIAGLLRFRPMAGESPVPGRVVRVLPDGTTRTLDETILWPNGIGHAPASDRLYISDYSAGRVLALSPDGGTPEVLCTVPEGAPDGLAVDAEGGIWVALAHAGAVARYEPTGERSALVPLPVGFASSIGFGGADGRDVRITGIGASGGVVLGARCVVPGVPSARAHVGAAG